MKFRGIFYLMFLVLILSLSGIEGCPGKEQETELGAYIGGANGLDISFIIEEPPAEVYDKDDPFYVTLLVENMGEYTIPKGKIISTLSGINKDDFSMKSLDVKSKSELFGRSKVGQEVIEGGLDELQFDEAEYKLGDRLHADFTTQLRADVCYAYRTDSLAKLCLKKNPVQRNQEDICKITNENVEIENSGAPLQIKDVKSRAGVDSVTFTFVVENKDSGEVYEDFAFSDKCEYDKNKIDRVRVKVNSDLDVKCGSLGEKSTGVVRLVDGRKTISCNVRTTGLQESAFEKPFDIVLDYFYKEAIGKGLTILDAEY